MAKLFPKTRPYKTGWLEVEEGHRIYYELVGNPKGKPVIVFHGGPGAGISKRNRQFLNPKKTNAVFFDQRGCGKSKPLGSLKANTTGKLVQDTKKLLDFLGIERAILFGGSWGSTLALAFAIKFPGMVAGMVLRGIYLGSRKDTEYFLKGPAKELFPEERERFLAMVPEKQRKRYKEYYFRKIKSKNARERKKFAFEWDLYEHSIMALKPDRVKIVKKLKKGNRKSALLEAHYFVNNCFMKENFILRNAHKLSGIPTTIIHGRYDIVCSPLGALRLHRGIRGSRLFFTIAGHYSADEENTERLFSETQKMLKVAKF